MSAGKILNRFCKKMKLLIALIFHAQVNEKWSSKDYFLLSFQIFPMTRYYKLNPLSLL